MTFLVDANVLSEPTKPAPDLRVVDWLRANEGALVVDPVIVGELYAGILGLAAGRKRRRLEQWFEAVVQTLECMPWDAKVGMRWAKLVVELRKKGESLPLLDSLIAATALAHGLMVATRNTRDFTKAGVDVVNPFHRSVR
jgi:hypothetical protein